MAKDKKINYQDLTDAELVAKSREFRHELFNLRLQKATARLEKILKKYLNHPMSIAEDRVIEMIQGVRKHVAATKSGK